MNYLALITVGSDAQMLLCSRPCFSDWLCCKLPVVWTMDRDCRTAHSNFRPELEENFGNEQSGQKAVTATLSRSDL